jgi:hypothetical protein
LTPVDQSVFDDGKGDCLRASVASVLDLPASDVPNFAERDYFAGLYKWLDERGMRAFEVRFGSPEDMARAWFNYHDTYGVMWGDSPRFAESGKRKGHAVVGQPNGYGCKVVHDPHPSRDGLHSCFGVMWIAPKA